MEKFFDQHKVDLYDEGREACILRARKEGWDIIESDENTLLIDIDSRAQADIFNNNLRLLKDVAEVESIERYFSHSGEPHEHVIIKIDGPMGVVERLFFQLLLGSDPIREYLSFLRYKNGDAYPSILLRKGNTNTSV